MFINLITISIHQYLHIEHELISFQYTPAVAGGHLSFTPLGGRKAVATRGRTLLTAL